MHKCVCVYQAVPAPSRFAEWLLSVSCVIAWWRFTSSETFPCAWFSLNLWGKRNTFPSLIFSVWYRELNTFWYSTVCARSAPPHTYIYNPQIHKHCIHTYSASQYLSDGKVFSLRLTWLLSCIHKENIWVSTKSLAHLMSSFISVQRNELDECVWLSLIKCSALKKYLPLPKC